LVVIVEAMNYVAWRAMRRDKSKDYANREPREAARESV
jgi:hypothetical protein